MDRKQAGILASLLVLILIVGWATWRLKDDTPNFNKPVVGLDGQEPNETDDTFIQSQIERDNSMVVNMQLLEKLIDDQDTAEDERKLAQAQLTNMVKQNEMEKSLERELMAQGYKQVLCMVSDDFNNVNVYLKIEDDLTEEQFANIRAIVVSQTKIKEVEISRKS